MCLKTASVPPPWPNHYSDESCCTIATRRWLPSNRWPEPRAGPVFNPASTAGGQGGKACTTAAAAQAVVPSWPCAGQARQSVGGNRHVSKRHNVMVEAGVFPESQDRGLSLALSAARTKLSTAPERNHSPRRFRPTAARDRPSCPANALSIGSTDIIRLGLPSRGRLSNRSRPNSPRFTSLPRSHSLLQSTMPTALGTTPSILQQAQFVVRPLYCPLGATKSRSKTT